MGSKITEAKARYNKANTKTYCIRLNKKTDKDVIEILEKARSKQGLVKSLIRLYREDILKDLVKVGYIKE